MICLKQVRDKIRSLSSHYAESIAHTTEIDEIINDAQEHIFFLRPWMFVDKEAQIPMRPDIIPNSSQTISVNRMERLVNFANPINRLGGQFYASTYDGQVMEIAGRDYRILTVESADSIRLEDPFEGTDDLVDSVDWKIKHPFYRAPEDCVELKSFKFSNSPDVTGTRSEGRIVGFEKGYCDDMNLTSSMADTVYMIEDLEIPAGELISATWTDTSGETSSIPANMWVEVCWAFTIAGRVGPLSQSVITRAVNGAATGLRLNVLCKDFQNQPVETPVRPENDVPYPMRWEGMRKVLFFNHNINQSATTSEGVRRGLPCWKPVLDFDQAGSQLEFKQLSIDWSESIFQVLYLGCFIPSANTKHSPGGQRALVQDRYIPNSIQQFQPYPRLTFSEIDYPQEALDEGHNQQREVFKPAIITYSRMPTPMAMETDGMSLPDAFSNLLAYKSLEVYLAKIHEAGMASFFAAKFDRELVSLERKYLSATPKAHRSPRWGRTSSAILFGDVTIND